MSGHAVFSTRIRDGKDMTGVGPGADVVVGFERGLDLLDLRGMYLHLTAGGFTGAAGELTTFGTDAGLMVVADLNGDRMADFAVRVTGIALLSAADFLL